MRYFSYIVATATLAVAVAGCSDPYYPRNGYSQSYNSPPGYSYQPSPGYSYSQPGYAYSQPGYAYSSSASDRNYNGIHPGPERTVP
jgi:hypothetical protein